LLDSEGRKVVDINYVNLVASLRREIATLRSEIGLRDDALDTMKEKEHELKIYVEATKKIGKDAVIKNTRILLDRQKKAYQILVAKLRREIRRLKFQRNSLSDPLIEAKYFPYLPRTAYGTSARKPPLGIIGNLPPRSSDYFALNPPPPTGNHPDSGNRWWWGSGPDLSSHLPPPKKADVTKFKVPNTSKKATVNGNNAAKIPTPALPSSHTSKLSPLEKAIMNPPVLPKKLDPLHSKHTAESDAQVAESVIDGDEFGDEEHKEPKVGDRACVVINGERCLGMVKYVGIFDPHPESGIWCGVKLDRPCKFFLPLPAAQLVD
jgi:hypothetical protein